MISQKGLENKTDEELIEIWANQKDYISEMVELVRAEIGRRGLNIKRVKIRTLEAKTDPIAIENKNVRVFSAAVVGIAFGTAFYIFLGLFVWVVIHTWSEFGVNIFFVVCFIGPVIIAIWSGLSSFRKRTPRNDNNVSSVN